MDWATNDYTKTYADTIYVPEPEYDTGVYLLDETGPDSDPGGDLHRGVPIRRYGQGPCGDRAGRHGMAARRPWTPGTREGYYTGGNIVSDRSGGNNRRVFDVAWDQTPQHYNPGSGPDWAHLVPDPRDRPYGGGPAPSLAFPIITHSEAIVGPHRNPAPGSPSKECFGGNTAVAPVELSLQYIKVILLVIIVVLLAATLTVCARLARGLEKTIKEAVKALGAVARGK